MKKVVILGFILRGIILTAQKADPAPFANSISTSELKSHLMVLTADSLEGRETGTEGNRKAAQYIARYFESLGLPKVGDNKSSYFQRMVYTNEAWNSSSVQLNNQTYRHLYNFYAYPSTNPSILGNEINADEIVFLGYGIDDTKYSDYKKAGNLKGKIIMINAGEPLKADSVSVLTKTKNLSVWSADIKEKLKVAYKKGVKTVLIIDPDLSKSIQNNRRFFSRNVTGDVEMPDGQYPNNIYISPDMAREIIGKNSIIVKKAREKMMRGKSRPVILPCKVKIEMDKYFKQLIGNNILGFIEGTDPVLKNEIVIISAHYDHLGKRGESIYHGADDNGSGTSTVLEIAQGMVEAKKKGIGPRRSVLCLLMTGEEKGLLGSKYYVTYPVFPLEKTVADVNIDMVGRVDEKHKADPNYIYVIGADKLSTDLHNINEEANKIYTNLELDYTYNDENDPNRYYYRSDHYNFAEQGIPAIFYFNGTHDDYHMPSDTVDKINFEKMVKIGKLAFYTAWELANRDERIRVDKSGSR
jgi:Peptidase family M28